MPRRRPSGGARLLGAAATAAGLSLAAVGPVHGVAGKAAAPLAPMAYLIDRAISYRPPAAVAVAGGVLVFTSPLCPHCRRLHLELDEWLQEGVAVHYLPLPLRGLHDRQASATFAIWCQGDPQVRRAFYDRAVRRRALPSGLDTCTPQEEEGYRFLARLAGAEATPTFVLPDGSVFSGGVDAGRLASWLRAWESGRG